MAKLIKKSKCKFEAGHIVRKEKIIGVPYAVWCQLNKLEIILQQEDYLRSADKYCPGPSLDGFVRKSIFDGNLPYVDAPETPVTDKRVEEAMAFMAEVDAVNEAEKINNTIDEYGELIDWLAADKIIDGAIDRPIDTPVLGNPLELTPDDVAAAISYIVHNPIELEG